MEKKFIAGSLYFFKDMSDYKLHDLDYVIITDEMFRNYHHIFLIEDGIGKDYFYWKKNTPEWHVNSLLSEKSFSLDIARVLIPEVCKELGFTIEHLKQVKPVLDKIESQVGPKYNYYKIIYDSYIENNDFVLTEEQRLKAYQSYRESRKKE